MLPGARGAHGLDEVGGRADLLGLLGLARLGGVVVADRGERGVGADADVLGGAGPGRSARRGGRCAWQSAPRPARR
eukprot:8740025-Alexandrium_andersonii.AAC.1